MCSVAGARKITFFPLVFFLHFRKKGSAGREVDRRRRRRLCRTFFEGLKDLTGWSISRDTNIVVSTWCEGDKGRKKVMKRHLPRGEDLFKVLDGGGRSNSRETMKTWTMMHSEQDKKKLFSFLGCSVTSWTFVLQFLSEKWLLKMAARRILFSLNGAWKTRPLWKFLLYILTPLLSEGKALKLCSRVASSLLSSRRRAQEKKAGKNSTSSDKNPMINVCPRSLCGLFRRPFLALWKRKKSDF